MRSTLSFAAPYAAVLAAMGTLFALESRGLPGFDPLLLHLLGCAVVATAALMRGVFPGVLAVILLALLVRIEGSLTSYGLRVILVLAEGFGLCLGASLVRRLRSELADERRRFEQMLGSITDALFVIDSDGRFAFVNKRAEEFLRCRSEELLGRLIWEEIPAVAGFPLYEALRVKGGRRESISFEEYYYPLKAWLEFRVYPQQGGWTIYFRDITSRKEQEKQLREAKRLAEDANKAKSLFLANMSHEVRTPLTCILGLSELMFETKTAPDKNVAYAKRIYKSGKNLLRILNDVLDLSKVEAGELRIDKTHVEVQAVLAEVVELFEHQCLAKEIGLDLRIAPQVPQLVHTDATRLRQILINVIGNAVKFTKAGSVMVDVRMLGLAEGGEHLQVDVVDTGIGLSPTDQQRLFQPFVQADASTGKQFGGTGLGLALSRRLAHMLDGELSIARSSPGEGSTFRLLLPAKSQNQRRVHETGDFLVGKNVLVVDDVRDNQILVEMQLLGTGVNVVCVDNGFDALTIARQQSFDFILMDVQMPGLDGRETTKRLRAAGYDGPIIALTAYGSNEDKERCLLAGCSAVLSKPVPRATLVEMLSEVAAVPELRGSLAGVPRGSVQQIPNGP